jgi:hypothetical protein
MLQQLHSKLVQALYQPYPVLRRVPRYVEVTSSRQAPQLRIPSNYTSIGDPYFEPKFSDLRNIN